MDRLNDIVKHFAIEGEIAEIKPLGSGLINDTYKVTTKGTDTPDYVLQRINHHIFTDVDALQSNITAVTRHLRRKLEAEGAADIDRRVLHFLPTVEDASKTYFFDGENYWRVMTFIPDALTFDIVNPEYSRHAGRAFGKFQADLVDIPETLVETIPDFHNMEFRLQQLREAIADDKAGRLADVRDIADKLLAHADEMCLAEQLHREGRLPKRICHCDTKVNNMLFDRDGKVLCVIDLDTVMPSYVFSDFGDFMRTAANTAPEDEPDLDKIGFDMEIFKAFAQGYISATRNFLTPVECDHLPYAVTLFPYMQAVRFLTDYLNGDTYYKTAYPEHNLVRARAQWRYFELTREALPAMRRFITSLCSGRDSDFGQAKI